jgi:hypothetical protein
MCNAHVIISYPFYIFGVCFLRNKEYLRYNDQGVYRDKFDLVRRVGSILKWKPAKPAGWYLVT